MQQEPKENNTQPIDMSKLIEARRLDERARVCWEWMMEICGKSYEDKATDVLKAMQSIMEEGEQARQTMNSLIRQAEGIGNKLNKKSPKKGDVSVSN